MKVLTLLKKRETRKCCKKEKIDISKKGLTLSGVSCYIISCPQDGERLAGNEDKKNTKKYLTIIWTRANI